MKLPPFGKTAVIKFSSLRNGLSDGLGVVCDIDTMVTRRAYRVRAPGGWKWQIKNYNRLKYWDWTAETDQQVLDEIGQSDEVEIVFPA